MPREDWLSRDKDWGPRFGPCNATAWKDERSQTQRRQGQLAS